MIGMTRIQASQIEFRRLHEHTLRTHLADHSRQRTPQLQVVFDTAIGHAQKDQ